MRYVFNNSTELLRRDKKLSGVKFTEEQRNILLEFRRLHLYQQQQERAKLELRKMKAKEYDARGNPVTALLGSFFHLENFHQSIMLL